MKTFILRHSVFALPLLAAAACGSSDYVGDGTELESELESSFGGQTIADEAPDFGDPGFAEVDLAADVAPIADALPTNHDNPRGLRLLVQWGYLPPRPDATDTIDWSGSITATNAALRVLGRVRFEPRDELLKDRTDPTKIEFSSHTKGASDGLLLEVVTGPDLNPSNGSVTLTFTSAPITKSLIIAPGTRPGEVVDVDEAGHILAYHFVRPNAGACREGFIRGRWTGGTVNGTAVGTIEGRMESNDGRLYGDVKGIFGRRKDGHNLFFAKVIGTDGTFKALLAGQYGEGKFVGRILLGPDHRIDGHVDGRYFEPFANEQKPGGFQGHWSQGCRERGEEGMPLMNDDQPPMDGPPADGMIQTPTDAGQPQ